MIFLRISRRVSRSISIVSLHTISLLNILLDSEDWILISIVIDILSEGEYDSLVLKQADSIKSSLLLWM